MSNYKDATKWLADPSNYTKGRSTKISQITIHHMAGVMKAKECAKIFQKKGRNGSANYGVGNGGAVGLYVDEANTAWADSDWASNCRTVSIEVSNSKTGGDWPVSDTAYKALVKLVADIAKRNGLGKLVVGKNLRKHCDFAATACPGPYLKGKMDQLAKDANAINYPTTSSTSSTQKFKKGDKIVIKAKGNATPDGSGVSCGGVGWTRYVLSYTSKNKYPYKIGSKAGVVTGYYKESALKKA